MKIIQDIIEGLIQTNESLTGPLFKGKFLANKINNETMLDWINSELDGYEVLMEGRGENVPRYRKHGASLIGSYYIGYTPYDNMPLPTVGLSEDLADFMRTMILYDSVSSLEKLNVREDTNLIAMVLPPELSFYIEKAIRSTNSGFRLVSAKKTTSSTFISQALTSIRSKFLDFMMELDEQFGQNASLDDLKEKKEKIDKIVNYYTIHNTGDGALINTGNNSKIDNDVKVRKGDFASLSKKLEENLVKIDDINDLQNILSDDIPDTDKKLFGIKTNVWITKMLAKTLDGTWTVTTGTAGTLLAEAIKLYYGW